MNFLARLLLALVFVVAGISKAVAPNQFAQQVGDFGLVYDSLVVPTAHAIIVAELLVGFALLIRLRGSLTAATTILLAFISVLTYGIVLGLDIECGCFGPAVRVSLKTQLVTDCGLLLVCVIIYWSDQSSRRPFTLAPHEDANNHETL